jgi:YfiH family protein
MIRPFVKSPALDSADNIRHGFFGRQGGVSPAPFASNNASVSTGDSEDNVDANRAAIAETLGFDPADLFVLKQVHSADVVTLHDYLHPSLIIEADGLVTALPGQAIGILTADCTPILFADTEAGIVGAAHAGWKGAVGAIAANVVAAMEEIGADRSRILASIGPTISGPNYEVGPDFMAEVLALQPDAESFFSIGASGREHFDLPGYVEAQLVALGLKSIDRVGGCTYAQPDVYFSHRFATHGESKTGRQLAVIGLI